MITIQQSPAKFTPAFNPVYFRISSSNYAQPDFKYVADVYSDSGQLLASLKYQPQVSGNQPIDIDVSRMLQELVAANYCKLNEVATPDIVVPGAGAIAGYSVQFGEQYNNVVHANLISFSGYVFNAAMNNKRFAFYDQGAWINKRFLTNFPRQIVRKADSMILSILQSDTVVISSFAFQVFDGSGTSLYSANISNPYTSLAATSNRALHLHCGFSYLQARLGFPLSVYNNAAYYTIAPPGGSAMRVDLYSRCERFQGIRLYFLNEHGGFDSFNFMLIHRYSYTTEKQSYQRQPENKRTGYDAVNKRFEALTRNYATKYREQIQMVSDYLTDAESKLLGELMYSPLVYMQIDADEYWGTGTALIPVNIKTEQYTVKRTRVDKMFNVEMEIELTHDNYMQTI
jgi:hypothetical protein